MNKEEAIKYGIEWLEDEYLYEGDRAFIEIALEALKQESCEMTAEEYRQRMIQAFHNADTDELIAVCVLPTEKEFEHLEWLLKNHYKKEPCGNAIDRAEAIKVASGYCHPANVAKELAKLPPVNPTKTGWIPVSERLPEKNMTCLVAVGKFNLTQMAMYSDLMGTINRRIFYQGDVGYGSFEDITEYVKAWMPLPAPYEPKESEG